VQHISDEARWDARVCGCVCVHVCMCVRAFVVVFVQDGSIECPPMCVCAPTAQLMDGDVQIGEPGIIYSMFL
jgi:hypothetical protein